MNGEDNEGGRAVKRIFFVLGTLLLGSMLWACGGSSTKGSSADAPKATTNQNPSSSGSGQAASSVLKCREDVYNGYSDPETEAVARACYDANLQQFDFAPSKSVLVEKNGSAAKVRVVGFSQSCQKYCPGDIDITYSLFVNRYGNWSASDSGASFYTSAERLEAAKQAKLQIIKGITATVVDAHPELQEGNFRTRVNVSQVIEGLTVELLVDVPNVAPNIVFGGWPNNFNQLAGFNDLPGPNGYVLPGDVYRLNGEKVNITHYRIVDYSTQAIGDWTPVN